MELKEIGEVIAAREYESNGGSPVTLFIGRPQKFPSGGGFFCPYRIVGLGDDAIRHAGGEDAIQALLLALKKIGARLYTSPQAKSGALRWKAAAHPGDLGLPVPESIRDLTES